MNYKNRILISVFVAVVFIFSATAAVAEQEKPSGTITISSTSVAIGIGVNWGHGVLKFKGKEYKFKVNGLSVVDLGVSSISAAGEVYRLENLSDFAGTYYAGAAGIAVGGGAGVAAMENQHDVVIKLKSTKQGVQLTLAPSGVRIKLVE
jgi:hypothetical protein